MKEIEYQQKMCASAGQIPPLQEQTAKAGKQQGLVPVSHLSRNHLLTLQRGTKEKTATTDGHNYNK